MNLIRIAFDSPEGDTTVMTESELHALLAVADRDTRDRFKHAEYLPVDGRQLQTWGYVRRYGYSVRAFVPWGTR